tara:strand:- start:38 stop:682 length:645 start_codon:yes stop_codon:yes gene_type:complete
MEIIEKKISNTPNKNLMLDARESLRGKWGLGIKYISLTWLLFFILNAVPLLGIIVGGTFLLGISKFALSFVRSSKKTSKKDTNTVFISDNSFLDYGFSRFSIAIGANVLSSVFVFLWSILLIIPGIIATYSYSMVWFVISDNENIGPLEALNKSKEMMKGYKWKLFCLHLRFFGWYILSILSFGIGLLWFLPYLTVTMANFYNDILDHEKLVDK